MLESAKLKGNRNVSISSRKQNEVIMKKFLTSIALASAFIPALHGMVPTVDINKTKIDHFISLINNADVEQFKKDFDDLTPHEKNILGSIFEQPLIATREVIIKEIQNLGNNNRSWSRISKGSLAILAGISSVASMYMAGDMIMQTENSTPRIIRDIAKPCFFLLFAVPSLIPGQLLSAVKKSDVSASTLDRVFGGTLGILSSIATYKFFTYGYKNIKVGSNYKQYLQDKLTNIDAIIAHITQAIKQATQQDKDFVSEVLERWLVETGIVDQ
jgi:hypothetical protein